MKIAFFVLFCVLQLSGCQKYRLDAQVSEMCANDGGTRIYETVPLPPEKFNEWRQVNFSVPLKDSVKRGDEYFYEWEITYYRTGNPELSKGHFKVIRQKDLKLLGESVYYSRGGGDLPGPWHGTSFRCPADADISILKTRIFIPTGTAVSK